MMVTLNNAAGPEFLLLMTYSLVVVHQQQRSQKLHQDPGLHLGVN